MEDMDLTMDGLTVRYGEVIAQFLMVEMGKARLPKAEAQAQPAMRKTQRVLDTTEIC